MKPICGAKTRAGTPCKRPRKTGMNRCQKHGGASLVGVAYPAFKDGRYSKRMKELGLVEKYAAARHDPELLNQSEEVALLQAMIDSALAKLDIVAFRIALRSKDQRKQVAAFAMIEDVAGRGAADADADAQMAARGLIQEKRRVIESERKRRIEMQDMLTSDEAMLLFRAVMAAIDMEVKDTAVIGAIHNRIALLTAKPRAGASSTLPC